MYARLEPAGIHADRLAEADRDDERHHGGDLGPPLGRTRRHDVGDNVTHDVRHADR
ncbi:hypothetical protein [Streptomyces phaeoluteigriseus]|uniref:hypothetical protein n=1 Tax=Streptomyces phaeoluteigriseus TaxID=114686 RepID=UPI001301DD91|nr:hypothetical protein [Streptomyces phaeoluteigriseus]